MFIQCFIDGAVRNNGTERTNEGASAVVIYKDKKEEIVSFVRGLGDVSNNAAEYQALIDCLLICWSSEFPQPVIYTDSLLVYNHTKRNWDIKSQSLLPYYITVQEIAKVYSFTIEHVPRSYVTLPDSLCNRYLDELELSRKVLDKRSPKKAAS